MLQQNDGGEHGTDKHSGTKGLVGLVIQQVTSKPENGILFHRTRIGNSAVNLNYRYMMIEQ